MNAINLQCDAASERLRDTINAAAERAHIAMRFQTEAATRHIVRMAEFPARSAGQLRRYAKLKGENK